MKKQIAALFIGAFTLALVPSAEAQLLKKLVNSGSGQDNKEQTPKENGKQDKGGSKIIGEGLISTGFTADEFGISGNYYRKAKSSGNVYINLFELSVCTEKSDAKGAQDLPACLKLNIVKPKLYASGNVESESSSGEVWDYAHPTYLTRTKQLYFRNSGNVSSIFSIEEGVLYELPNNMSSSFSGEVNWDNINWDYMLESGTFYVKNKDDLDKWANPDKEAFKKKIREHVEGVNAIYKEIEAKKKAGTAMPSIGKLNTKVLQDQAFRTYVAKYESINKGWTHQYCYVHGNEWQVKQAKDNTGKLYDHHRELQVVIVRTSPSGECRADLMFYVEMYENGKPNPATGKVTGPVSYIGMPGGPVPCDKATSFKAGLAK